MAAAGVENTCQRGVLLAYARHDLPDDLFGLTERTRCERAMMRPSKECDPGAETLGRPSPWSPDIKASDDFLTLFSTATSASWACLT